MAEETKTPTTSGFTPKDGAVTAIPYDPNQGVNSEQGVAIAVKGATPEPVFITADNSQKIKPESLVDLLVILVHNGNATYPGRYKALEIPKQYWTPDKVRLVGSGSNVISPNSLEIKRQKISLTTETPGSKKETYANSPGVAVTRNLEPTSTTEGQASTQDIGKVSINTATLSQLEGLDNVGTATANKIIDERQKTPFADLADLEKRVKLHGNAQWSGLESQLIFSDPEAAKTQEKETTK